MAEARRAAAEAEYEQLKAERDQLLDRLARLQAEFENARKRAERERAEFRDFATGQRGGAVSAGAGQLRAGAEIDRHGAAIALGVSLIVKQMEEILREDAGEAGAAVGEAFDPRIHEALGSVERDDVPDQHVAEEVRRGYRLRERLLRPALVRVAHNPKQVNE